MLSRRASLKVPTRQKQMIVAVTKNQRKKRRQNWRRRQLQCEPTSRGRQQSGTYRTRWRRNRSSRRSCELHCVV